MPTVPRLRPQCRPCDDGTVAPQTGMIDCQTCLAGAYQDRLLQQVCSACIPGSYQSSNGTIACDACIPGRYTNVSHSTSCSPCLPGTFALRVALEYGTLILCVLPVHRILRLHHSDGISLVLPVWMEKSNHTQVR